MLSTLGESPVSGPDGEHFEESHWVLDAVEAGVNLKFSAEAGPLLPGPIAASGVLSAGATLLCMACSAEISEEVMSGLKWQSCQDLTCG